MHSHDYLIKDGDLPLREFLVRAIQENPTPRDLRVKRQARTVVLQYAFGHLCTQIGICLYIQYVTCNICSYTLLWGGFDFRWCHWNFSLT